MMADFSVRILYWSFRNWTFPQGRERSIKRTREQLTNPEKRTIGHIKMVKGNPAASTATVSLSCPRRP
jgi:hypothetical protein